MSEYVKSLYGVLELANLINCYWMFEMTSLPRMRNYISMLM